MKAGRASPRTRALGRVDGFDQDQAASECDECAIALCGLLAAHGDALEAFQLAHRLFDPGAGLVEQLGKEVWPVLGIRAMRNDGNDTAFAAGGAIGGRVVALVGQRRAGRDVGPDVERGFKLGAIADLAAGQVESNGQAVEIRLEVDLAGEAAPRAAECLILLPPFAPAAETCARTTVLSNICTMWAVWLDSARSWKNASNTPERLSRQNRFQMLFQLPNAAGRARHVMLWTVKKCSASKNFRSSCPGSP